MTAIPKKPLPFGLACTRPVRNWAIGAFVAVTAAMIGGRINVYLLRVLTDTVVSFGKGDIPVGKIWTLALIFPAIYLVTEMVWRCSGFCGMRWIPGAGAEAFRKLYTHLTGHSASYFGDRYAGALTNKITNAAKGIENLIANVLWQFYPMIIGVLLDIVLTGLSHWYFSAVLGGWCAIYVGLNIFLVRKLHKLAFASAEASSTLKGKIVDSASNIETVHHSGEVEFERRFIGDYIVKQRTAHIREWFYSEWILVTNGLLIAVFMVLMLGGGVLLIERGEISVGSLVLVLTVVMNLESRFFFLGQQFSQSVSYYGQVGEGLTELLEPHAITNAEGAPDLRVRSGAIEFDRVSFAYRENSVFNDFSIAIRGGEKVGLVGPSGAGKSTLVNVLLRHFDVREGAVRIDGSNIREVELQSLRRAIAVVPQTTSLFHRSIRDNIRYGRLEATDEEIYEAARLAQADQFIRAMPKGYDTFVGERGVKLSGGQRQRIAVARALLKQAPILILDEATSSLDSESEAAIQQALTQLMQGRTVLAIAHRLSTLRLMDRIVVLDHGRVVEDGPHSVLVKGSGLYARLWNSQISGFIQDHPGSPEAAAKPAAIS